MSEATGLAVVGGGLAGLMAATRARELGWEVLLVEMDERVGGQVCSRRRPGWLHEGGATVLGEVGPDVERLLDSAGVTAERVEVSAVASRRYMVHDGESMRVPATPGELINSPLLSVAGRLRMLKEPFVARGGTASESVAEFASRRLGPEAAQRLIAPAVVGRGGGDPEELLARYALRELVEFERRSGSILKGRMRKSRQARREGRATPRPWSCDGGLGRVPELLAATLGDRVMLAREVTGVEPTTTGFRVELGDGMDVEVAGVVVAVPAPAAAKLFAQAAGVPAISGIAAIRYQPLAVCSLGFRRESVTHPLDGFGLSLPTDAGYRMLNVTFNSSILPDTSPPGTVLLSALTRASVGTGSAESQDILVTSVRNELGALLGVQSDPIECEVFEWLPGSPQPEGEHAQRLACADAFEVAVPGVAFCGAWHDGAGLADVMRGGIAAADRVIDRLGAPGSG